jgi:hypothetical protein
MHIASTSTIATQNGICYKLQHMGDQKFPLYVKQANDFFGAYVVLTKFGHQSASSGFYPSFSTIINFFHARSNQMDFKRCKPHMFGKVDE